MVHLDSISIDHIPLLNCEIGLYDQRFKQFFHNYEWESPIASRNQLSKASSKTHFQLVQRWSLPYKLVFTDPQKYVISASKNGLLTLENHSLELASGDLAWRECVFWLVFASLIYIQQESAIYDRAIE
jgi:hypothetical protein